MIYLLILFALSILGLLYMRFEAGFVQVTHVKFTKNTKHLKVIQLSDIHIDHLKVSSSKVKKVINKVKPDFILLTGDYINRPFHIPNFLKFLDEIVGLAPMYLCLGNHDYKAFLDNDEGLNDYINLIAARGVTILHNTSVCFEKNAKKYNIIGFADIRYSHQDIEGTLEKIHKDVYKNIAISHNPDIILNMHRNCVDYLFCGHFHGGQIWLPFNLEFKTLRDEKLCRIGITRGLHTINGIKLYINRGLGSVLFPFRFMSRPEITVIYLP